MTTISYDMNTVCKKLNTTSRTLRYYESKGLITSIRTGEHTPRRYTAEELVRIERILELRSLGIPVKDILPLLSDHTDLKTVLLHQLQIFQKETEELDRTFDAISNAILRLSKNAPLFSEEYQSELLEKQEAAAIEIANGVLSGNYCKIVPYISPEIPADSHLPIALRNFISSFSKQYIDFTPDIYAVETNEYSATVYYRIPETMEENSIICYFNDIYLKKFHICDIEFQMQY